MAGNVPATHTFKGDGVTRVFPISTKIIGDDYVRIEIDSEYIFDRKSWDIVNNSIIFTVAPANNTTVLIKVAESVEAVGLLDNQSTADIIEANIPVINDVYNNLDKIETVTDNLDAINNVDNIKTDINIVADKIDTLEIIADSLGDLQDIKNHNNLTGRDQANAHPISAITGLQETLDGLSNDGGLFPSLTSDYISPNTFLSCKISSTELRAVPVEEILTPMYNTTPDTPTVYDGLNISQTVYGKFNTNLDYYKASKYFRYCTANKNYFKQTANNFMIDPLTLNSYLAFSTSYLVHNVYSYLSTGASTLISDSTISAIALTDTYKIITLNYSTSGAVSVYDLKNKTVSKISGTIGIQHKYSDLQLHPNGKVYAVPSAAESIMEIDPETNSYNLYGNLGVLNNKYCKGLLGVNGNIYFIPKNATDILEFNPVSKVITSYPYFNSTANKFATATVGVDGCFYMFADELVTDNLYKFNPITKEYTAIPYFKKICGEYEVAPTSPVAPKVTKAITGVDGNLYFFSSYSSSNNILTKRACIFGINPEINSLILDFNISTVKFLHHTLDGTISSDLYFLVGSNKGNHFWVMSNYFWKGF